MFLLILMIGCGEKITWTSYPEKFDITTLPDPGSSTVIGDTNYIEILPPWGGFEEPTAILMGNDQLLYIVDHANNEIVMMDIGGAVLKRRTILHPTSIAQNSKLDLYIGGEAISPNGNDTMGVIYKISLVRYDTVNIDTVIDPFTHDTSFVKRDTSIFYNHDLQTAPMKIVRAEIAHPKRRFPGIGILPGNGYLAARVGPDNSSFVDPDSRVLLFTKGDTLITPLSDLVTRSTIATNIPEINQLTGLTTLPASRDFMVLQSSSGATYTVFWMMYQKTADFDGWIPKYTPNKNPVDLISSIRFQEPTGVTVDKRRRDIFVVDSELDSVVKFDRNGRFKTESFGKNKSRGILPGLSHPHGVAFSNDCTLYITDTGNKLIRRFKLSTQTQCY